MRTGTAGGRLYVLEPATVKSALRRAQAALLGAGVIADMSEIATRTIERLEPQAALDLFKDRIEAAASLTRAESTR